MLKNLIKTTHKVSQRKIHIFDIPNYKSYVPKTDKEFLPLIESLPSKDQKICVIEYICDQNQSMFSYVYNWASTKEGLQFKENLIDDIHKYDQDTLLQLTKVFGHVFSENDAQEFAIQLSDNIQSTSESTNLNILMSNLVNFDGIVNVALQSNIDNYISQSLLEQFYRANRNSMPTALKVAFLHVYVKTKNVNDDLVYSITQEVLSKRGYISSPDFLILTEAILFLLQRKSMVLGLDGIKKDRFYQLFEQIKHYDIVAEPNQNFNFMSLRNTLLYCLRMHISIADTNLYTYLHRIFLINYQNGLDYYSFIVVLDMITASASSLVTEEVNLYLQRIEAEIDSVDLTAQAISVKFLCTLANADFISYTHKSIVSFKEKLDSLIRSGQIIEAVKINPTIFYTIVHLQSLNMDFKTSANGLIEVLEVNNLMTDEFRQFKRQFM